MRGTKLNKQIYDDNYQIKKALFSSSIIFNIITIIMFYFNGRFNITKLIISSIPEITVIFCILKISRPKFKYENKTVELIDPGTSLTNQGIPSLLFDILAVNMIVKFFIFYSYYWCILYGAILFLIYYELIHKNIAKFKSN